jgi:hypothetical protein
METRFEQPLVDALGREAHEGARAAGAALGLDEALELARSLSDAHVAASSDIP